MVAAIDAARYLISLDSQLKYFNTKKLITRNNHTFYEGNARINKILHLAQNMYIGRHGQKLIDADFYAYDNGGILLEVQENYAYLVGTREKVSFTVDEAVQEFLRRVFLMLKDAPINRLIDIDHEDPAWQEKCMYRYKPEQKMDSLKFKDEYSDMYEAANFYLDHMEEP